MQITLTNGQWRLIFLSLNHALQRHWPAIISQWNAFPFVVLKIRRRVEATRSLRDSLRERLGDVVNQTSSAAIEAAKTSLELSDDDVSLIREAGRLAVPSYDSRLSEELQSLLGTAAGQMERVLSELVTQRAQALTAEAQAEQSKCSTNYRNEDDENPTNQSV